MSGGKLSGTIKTSSHYFEEGNVQLDFSKSYEAALSTVLEGDGSDLEDIANAILKLILKFEDDAFKSLAETIEETNNKFLKAMRRIAPSTFSQHI